MDEAKPFKQRLNIGSRVTREGHARFWERPEVKFLRATRRQRAFDAVTFLSSSLLSKPFIFRGEITVLKFLTFAQRKTDQARVSV